MSNFVNTWLKRYSNSESNHSSGNSDGSKPQVHVEGHVIGGNGKISGPYVKGNNNTNIGNKSSQNMIIDLIIAILGAVIWECLIKPLIFQ